MSSAPRADPFAAADLDVSDFAPAAPKNPKPLAEAVRKVSEANNFPSRAPTAARPVKPQRRRRTGRSVQLNIKATQETIDRFAAISDRQKWGFGETLEHALAALEKSLAAKS